MYKAFKYNKKDRKHIDDLTYSMICIPNFHPQLTRIYLLRFEMCDDKYTAQINNAGVHCFVTMGNLDEALIFFRQALITKIGKEKHGSIKNMQNEHVPPFLPFHQIGDEISSQKRCVTPELTPESSCILWPTASSQVNHILPQSSKNVKPTLPSMTKECMPYICLCPLLLNDSTEFSSLVIVLNLGIVHQAMDASSVKTIYFYELVQTMLSYLPNKMSSPTSLLVQVVLLNNSAVWHYEQHDFESMTANFGKLKDLLNTTDVGLIDMAIIQGVQRNIAELLFHCFATSDT